MSKIFYLKGQESVGAWLEKYVSAKYLTINSKNNTFKTKLMSENFNYQNDLISDDFRGWGSFQLHDKLLKGINNIFKLTISHGISRATYTD